jgi:hypothetical protein
MIESLEPNAPADFDFYVGEWHVSHRRLKTRLANQNDWEAFSGVCHVYKTLGGFGNVDDNILELPSGRYRAMSIRAYDAASGNWSIWWLDGRNPSALDVPVVGQFDGKVGKFETRDSFQGRPIVVQFKWIVEDPESPRWEQAFSEDGGETWELNWVMDFTKRS